MQKYEICFVVLHYKTAEETKECFQSLMRLDGSDHMAVIMVDNSYALGDKSGENLFKYYRAKKNFYYVPNSENTFFSFGNNMGYRFAKAFHPDFIVVTNSDTVFKQRDFSEKLKNLEIETEFDLLGPDIVKYDVWEHQNPYSLTGMTVQHAQQDIDFYEKEIEDFQLGKKTIEPQETRKMPLMLRKIKRYVDAAMRGNRFWKPCSDCVLHGACIIVACRFIEENDSLFTPETELFCEEWILYHRAMKHGYKTLYSPKIQVLHKSSASINYDKKSLVERKILMYQKMIKARKVYIKYVNSGQQNGD